MSLLNLESDGRRGVLVAVYRLLGAEGAMERDRVLDLCAPKGVTERKYPTQTLNRWIELGLFQNASETISIHPDIPAKERTIDRLSTWARRRALAPENNERFWEATEARSADFTRAISWLLAQDIYDAEYRSWDDLQPVLQRQTPGNQTIFGQNDTRWNGLRAWGPFLGFGRVGNTRGSPFIIDPTDALRDALPRIFGKQKTLAADEFQDAVAVELPVLDGGEYRKLVEAKLSEQRGADAWQPPPQGQLSTSLSRALLRLTTDGTLQGESRADAIQRVRLTGRQREVVADFSHFTWQQNT